MSHIWITFLNTDLETYSGQVFHHGYKEKSGPSAKIEKRVMGFFPIHSVSFNLKGAAGVLVRQKRSPNKPNPQEISKS